MAYAWERKERVVSTDEYINYKLNGWYFWRVCLKIKNVDQGNLYFAVLWSKL